MTQLSLLEDHFAHLCVTPWSICGRFLRMCSSSSYVITSALLSLASSIKLLLRSSAVDEPSRRPLSSKQASRIDWRSFFVIVSCPIKRHFENYFSIRNIKYYLQFLEMLFQLLCSNLFMDYDFLEIMKHL